MDTNSVPTHIRAIAFMCHQVNKAWCEANKDYSQVDWEDAAEWQRESAIAGVEFKLNNPRATPEDQHKKWMDDKLKDGWVYGEEKDANAKTHPCLISYDQLPEHHRRKDALFAAIVTALAPKREQLTEGEKAVGITFNPGGSPDVNRLKRLSADLIDEIEYQKSQAASGEKAAQFQLAKREVQTGQMWAVKAATWQY